MKRVRPLTREVALVLRAWIDGIGHDALLVRWLAAPVDFPEDLVRALVAQGGDAAS